MMLVAGWQDGAFQRRWSVALFTRTSRQAAQERLMMSPIQAVDVDRDDAGADTPPIPGVGEPWHTNQKVGPPASGESPAPRIAVVDDDDDLHTFLKDLAAAGHFKLVGTFHNAAQALDRLSKHPP